MHNVEVIDIDTYELIKVLVVEDNPGDAKLVRAALAKSGHRHEAEVVTCVSTAVERLHEGVFDVVLLDLSLPDSEGIATVSRVHSEHPGVAIVVLTGLDDEQMGIASVRMGAQDYLVKGEFNTPLLTKAIRYAIERKKVEEALRDSEEMYATLVKTSPDAVIVIGLGCDIIEVSQRTLELYGYESADELVGISVFELITEEYRDSAMSDIQESSELGSVRNRDYMMLRKDGTVFIGELNASLIRDVIGEPSAFITTVRDITDRKLMERSLEESEEKYSTLVELSPDGIVLTEHEKVIFANRVFHDMLDFEGPKVLGKDLVKLMSASLRDAKDLVSADERQAVVRNMSEMMKGGSNRYTYRMPSKREREGCKWLEAHANPISYKGGAADLVVFRDITERKRAEEELSNERERLEAIIAGMTDGLIMLDRRGLVVSINPALEYMLGLKAKDVIGWCVSEGHGDDLQLQPLLALCNVSSSGEIVVDPGGRVLKVYASQVSDSVGQYLGEVRVVHDITKEKELQRLKDEFIANVSHELRTPLHSIRGFVTLIVEGKVPDPAKQQRFLELVDEQGQHLSNLVDDILDSFALESGRKRLGSQRVSMKGVIARAALKLGNIAGDKGITIDTKRALKCPDVVGDEEALEQVIINLVNNAIKFSPGGGQVAIEANRRDGKVLMRVIDHGVGIPADAVPKLFGKFYQVDSSVTRIVGGTGLGLYICRQIIEAHGGEIWVESEVGKGSTFSFLVPLWVGGRKAGVVSE